MMVSAGYPTFQAADPRNWIYSVVSKSAGPKTWIPKLKRSWSVEM